MGVLQIRVKRHGPYTIALEDAGAVRIVDHDGNELIPEPGRPIVLCRCGGSATKPFCDGTHKRNGFLRAADHRSGTGDRSSETRDQRSGGGDRRPKGAEQKSEVRQSGAAHDEASEATTDAPRAVRADDA